MHEVCDTVPPFSDSYGSLKRYLSCLPRFLPFWSLWELTALLDISEDVFCLLSVLERLRQHNPPNLTGPQMHPLFCRETFDVSVRQSASLLPSLGAHSTDARISLFFMKLAMSMIMALAGYLVDMSLLTHDPSTMLSVTVDTILMLLLCPCSSSSQWNINATMTARASSEDIT